MVLTLKGKETLEHDNVFQVGQSGLIGNPAAQYAFDDCDLLLMLGTDFPYTEWYPKERRSSRSTSRQLTSAAGPRSRQGWSVTRSSRSSELLEHLDQKPDSSHLNASVDKYHAWCERQQQLADPDYDSRGVIQKVRGAFDNPDQRIRPESVARFVDSIAAEDTIFTTDTGMSTVWLSRFVTMSGTRRLIGSYNLGSMANAMHRPSALRRSTARARWSRSAATAG